MDDWRAGLVVADEEDVAVGVLVAAPPPALPAAAPPALGAPTATDLLRWLNWRTTVVLALALGGPATMRVVSLSRGLGWVGRKARDAT